MAQTLFEWVLNIPIWIGSFSSWLTSPIGGGLNISPLDLLSVAGTSVLISILVIHVVRLFV